MAGALFDEDFTAACWEDTDLGTRLVSRGLRIIYNQEAVGYHFHPVDFRRYSTRATRAGFFEGLYRTKNRKPITNPPFVTMAIKRLLGAVLRWLSVPGLRERGYQWSLQWFSWRGLNEYLRMRVERPAERRGHG